MADNQKKYFDEQNILHINIDALYDDFIRSVDNARSHFNAMDPNATLLNTPEYQESRCSAFYRMIGLPVVANDKDFYSPGFDPTLNTDSVRAAKYKNISKSILSNNDLKSQLSKREQIPKDFATIFAAGDTKAIATMLGSIFIRSFEQQIGSTDPLKYDPNSKQVVDARNKEITKIFKDSSLTFKTNHQLKPFIVDPRIDSSVQPINNKIAAPFLKDKSQLQIFDGTDGQLKRPYIERVISTRFNNKNVAIDNQTLTTIRNTVLNDVNVKNTDLLDMTSNTLKNLNNSEVIIFNDYMQTIKALVLQLHKFIIDIEDVRHNINFKPTPDPKNGPESGNPGNKINSVDFNDIDNNKDIENNIKNQTLLKYQNELRGTLDAGLNGTADIGDFAFSNIEDHMSISNKTTSASFDEQISKQTNFRSRKGQVAIDAIKAIELIMGEFSGIGIIDMLAIQAALWIMDSSSLLGLIDDAAFARLKANRPNLNLNGNSQSDIRSSLQELEKQIKYIYLLTQKYIDSINNGSSFKSS
jgi:hypothetical protein